MFGFFMAENGLAQGVKMYAKAIEVADIPHAFLNTDFITWLEKSDLSYKDRLSKRAKYGINVIHINPDQWFDACIEFPRKTFDFHYTIGVWLWELEIIPKEWEKILPYVNELWAPSEFIASALRKVSSVPVEVIPYGIDVPVEPGVTRKSLGLPEDAFLVLTMYDSRSYAARKNPQAAIKAFAKAFRGKNTRAVMVIKINNPTPEDLAMIQETMGDIPYILIKEKLPKAKLNALIQLCDVFISLHRSEGFGLVMAEAMMLGVPTIATNWSANAEYMNDQNSCVVNYDLVPVKGQYQYEQDGYRWAEADISQGAEYLIRLYEDEAYRTQLCARGKKWMEEHYSVEACGAKIKQRYQQLLGELSQ